MSTRYTPEPAQIDYHADHEEARRRLALAKIHPEDLLAAVMDDLAEQPLADSPLGPMVLWLLDRALMPGDGAVLWGGLKAVMLTHLARLLDEVLADPTAWQTASEHYLPLWGRKPTVLEQRNLLYLHTLIFAH